MPTMLATDPAPSFKMPSAQPVGAMEPESHFSTTSSAPLPALHHGSASAAADAAIATLPPTLTPATTTRQSVALGVFSTLWPTDNNLSALSSDTTLLPTASTSHAPTSLDTLDLALDLTASTGSVPSATTTLTNTLPPTQSAALRALNAPAFQSSHSSPDAKSKAAKSTSSRTTLSSQPVVVRTYSGAVRNKSRTPSGRNSPRFSSMKPSGSRSAQHASALWAGLAGRGAAGGAEKLPSADDFTFSAILRAVDPEIRDAIDAIAEICAKSRMSLADEYDAHLPPQGEITGTGPGWVSGVGAMPGRGRISRIGQGWAAAETTLTAVPEASSSSERLAGGSNAGSSKKRSRSAYGSLKSVISGSSGKRRAAEDSTHTARIAPSSPQSQHQGPSWAVHASSPDHPAIAILTSPRASKHLSLDTSSTIRDILEDEDAGVSSRPQIPASKHNPAHRRNKSWASPNSTATPHYSHARSTSLAAFTSWLPWPLHPSGSGMEMTSNSQAELTRAESRLREVLLLAQTEASACGKGKAVVGVA